MTNRPATDVDAYLQQSSMIRLAQQFEQLATGAAQVPRQPVLTRIRNRIADTDVLEYHDRLVPKAGPLFSHFLASIPGILEEVSRVGVALSRLSRQRAACFMRSMPSTVPTDARLLRFPAARSRH
jgi:hypothetical protein